MDLPGQVGASRAGRCKIWARFGLLVLSEIEAPCHRALNQLNLSGQDARFGFGSGSRPLVFFGWSPGWIPPILNK